MTPGDRAATLLLALIGMVTTAAAHMGAHDTPQQQATQTGMFAASPALYVAGIGLVLGVVAGLWWMNRR